MICPARLAVRAETGTRIRARQVSRQLSQMARLRQLIARKGPHVMMSVTDSGIGMDAETQARIFEPFFTTKPVGEGTGLGLATVYGIVKQLGGHLRVYSELGRGSTFKVFFPSIVSGEVTPAAPRTECVEVTKGARILLVEDDAAVRAVVKGLLLRHEYDVTEMPSGDEALARLQRLPDSADLVLSDMMMPGLTGLELRQRLRDMGAKYPVLLMSGYSDGAMKRLGRPEGLAPHIEKPFTADRLVSAIEGLLRA
jgi:CheY-like chemotaxis protein